MGGFVDTSTHMLSNTIILYIPTIYIVVSDLCRNLYRGRVELTPDLDLGCMMSYYLSLPFAQQIRLGWGRSYTHKRPQAGHHHERVSKEVLMGGVS